MKNLVLKNQIVLGTVNAALDAFQAAIRDLTVFHRRWPAAVRALITGRYPIEAFGDLVFGKPTVQFVSVETAKRDLGQFQLKATPVPQETVDEHLARVAQTDALGTLVQGAGEDDTPEALDSAWRLVIVFEPIGEGGILIWNAILGWPAPRRCAAFLLR